MDYVSHVLSRNIHPYTGVFQTLHCGYPVHHGASPGAARHHLLHQRLCRDHKDMSAEALRAPPLLLLLSPQVSKGHFSHFFSHPSLSPTTDTTLAATLCHQNLYTCTQYNYLLSKYLRLKLFKNILYLFCIGLCDWKVHISQVSNNVSQYRNLLACFLQAIINWSLLKNPTYHCPVLSLLWLYPPSSIFFFCFISL